MGLKKKVTTKDIADHVGLSQSAVSMILNNKSNVSFSESTKSLVTKKRRNKQNPKTSLFLKLFWSSVHFYQITIIQLWYIRSPNGHMITDI